MISLELILWSSLLLLGLLGCALFAGLETGVYRLNKVRLHVQAHQGDRSAHALHQLYDRSGRLIASLLIATNVATNLATSAMGVILDHHGLAEWQVIIVDALIMTPVIMVFAETLPKDLFAVHADKLVYPFTRLMQVVLWLCRALGLLAMIDLASALVMRLLGAAKDPTPTALSPVRWRVSNLVKEGLGAGLLSDDQSAMVERVLSLGGRRVSDVMQPWTRVVRLRQGQSIDELWALAARSPHARFPFMDLDGRAKGVIHLHEALRLGKAKCRTLEQLVRGPLYISPDAPLQTALALLRKSQTSLAIVVRHGRPIGVVALKDLIEPVTGELANW